MNAIVVQPDNKIVTAGVSGNDFSIMRFNVNGSLDTTTFATGLGTPGKRTIDFAAGADTAYALALQPDGRIVVAGSATVSGTLDFGIARLLANGTTDQTFSSAGVAPAFRTSTHIGNP